jgi:hypothetical protein
MNTYEQVDKQVNYVTRGQNGVRALKKNCNWYL